MKLTISTNNASNPLTLDLTKFLDVQDGDGMDPASPTYSSKVIAHSLLKPGGFLALEDVGTKELVFPLDIDASNQSAMILLIEQINQVVTSPGATASWQDDGLSQPTIFDLVSGQFDVAYGYRRAQAKRTKGNLRLFTQPFGRTATPRAYAAASSYGPLLMISPYASGGALAIGASTQAGAAGFGGAPQGASTGIFYPGSPSLAGDAPALLRISYIAPIPPAVGASDAIFSAALPYAAVSLLPDGGYKPLITADQILLSGGDVPTRVAQLGAVAGKYIPVAAGASNFVANFGFQANVGEPQTYAGNHRVFAIARASAAPGTVGLLSTPATQATAATVNPATDWALFDVGTMSVSSSQYPGSIKFQVAAPGGAVDLSALVMLPDNTTWFLNPVGASSWNRSNALIVDDVLGEQFSNPGAVPFTLPLPLTPDVELSIGRITQYTRGLPPQPDPKNGVPVIAILGIGQPFIASSSVQVGASWPNPQNLPTLAQVSVVERARYVLP